MKALRQLALQYPEAEEGIACKGTAIECSTFKARDKAFLFVGAGVIRLKLHASLPEATKLAAKEPSRYKVGANGWIAVTVSDNLPPPLDVMVRWIDESYRLLAPKQLTAPLPDRGLARRTPRSPAKKLANSSATQNKQSRKKSGRAGGRSASA